MKEQISQADTCANDEMLLSVLLLQQYETLIHTAEKNPPVRAHLDGSLALIKHRGLHTFTNRVSQGLLFCVRAKLIGEALRDCQPLENNLDIGRYVEADANVSPDVQLDNIDVDVANLNALVNRILQSDESNLDSRPSEIGNLLCEASEIEKRLADWNADLPESWRPLTVSGENCILASIQRAGLYQPYCHVYPSLPVSSRWNRYRLAQIRIQSAIVNLLSQLASLLSITNEISRRRYRIQLEAGDICASFPHHIGDRTKTGPVGDNRVNYPHQAGVPTPPSHYLHAKARGGYMLINTLLALMSMKVQLREAQREWICAQIIRVYKLYRIVR